MGLPKICAPDGVKSRRSYRTWMEPEQKRLLRLIDLHPINEVAKLMHRSESSVWHMLYRLGANAEIVESWINRGWLKATQIEIGLGKRVVIQAEDFCEFCRKHTKDVVGNRLKKERLDSVYHFAFPPSHAELLPVRNAQKEQRAHEAQMREEIENSTERSSDKIDGLGQIA